MGNCSSKDDENEKICTICKDILESNSIKCVECNANYHYRCLLLYDPYLEIFIVCHKKKLKRFDNGILSKKYI